MQQQSEALVHYDCDAMRDQGPGSGVKRGVCVQEVDRS